MYCYCLGGKPVYISDEVTIQLRPGAQRSQVEEVTSERDGWLRIEYHHNSDYSPGIFHIEGPGGYAEKITLADINRITLFPIKRGQHRVWIECPSANCYVNSTVTA